MRGKRIRWANVGRLLAALAAGLALLALLPRLLAAPEPPPLPPDVGLVPDPVTADPPPRPDAGVKNAKRRSSRNGSDEGGGRAEAGRRGLENGGNEEGGRRASQRPANLSGEGAPEPERTRGNVSQRERRGRGDGVEGASAAPPIAAPSPPVAPAPATVPAPAPPPVAPPSPPSPPPEAPGEFGP